MNLFTPYDLGTMVEASGLALTAEAGVLLFRERQFGRVALGLRLIAPQFGLTSVLGHTWRGQIGGHPDAALHDAAVPVSRSSAQSRCALRMGRIFNPEGLLPAQLTRPIWTPCRLGV